MMIKNNFQSYMMFRLIGVISLIMGILCFGAYVVAKIIPSHLIIAQVIPINQITDSDWRANTSQLLLVDVHTGRYVPLRYPIDAWSNYSNGEISLSPSGRRALIKYWDNTSGSHLRLALWDIFSGGITYASKDICAIDITYGISLIDEETVSYICIIDDSLLVREGMTYNFFTQEQEYRGGYIIGQSSPSQDFSSSDRHSRARLYKTGAIYLSTNNEADFNLISASDKVYLTVVWHPDNQSFFALTQNTLEQYHLNDQSWDVIISNLAIDMDYPYLNLSMSPDGNWISFVRGGGGKYATLYTFNVQTREVIPITSDVVDLDKVVLAGWIQNAEWLLVHNQTEFRGRNYYLIRPDSTETLLIAENKDFMGLRWLDDNTKIAYIVYECDENRCDYDNSQAFIWDMQSPPSPIPEGLVRGLRRSESDEWYLYLGNSFKDDIDIRTLVYGTNNGEERRLIEDYMVLNFKFLP